MQPLPPPETTTNSIALIGPDDVGKTTIGSLIAANLGQPFDTHRMMQIATKEPEYNDDVASNHYSADGITSWYRYLLPMSLTALERDLSPSGVVEVNGWYCDPNDVELFDRFRVVLSRFDHVVFLTPSVDVDRAYRTIQLRKQPLINGIPFSEHFITHPSNRALAKHVVYTKGKSPEETRDEILAVIDPESAPVIFIGPMGTGKSTQGRLVSEALGRKQVPLDSVRWNYYPQMGWSKETEASIREVVGFPGVYRYWKQFEIQSVERIVAENPEAVIDFGAGQSVYEDRAYFERARAVLDPIKNIVLMLPSEDVEESIDILNLRRTITIHGVDASRYILGSDAHKSLANFLFDTEGLSPEECALAIIDRVK